MQPYTAFKRVARKAHELRTIARSASGGAGLDPNPPLLVLHQQQPPSSSLSSSTVGLGFTPRSLSQSAGGLGQSKYAKAHAPSVEAVR